MCTVTISYIAIFAGNLCMSILYINYGQNIGKCMKSIYQHLTPVHVVVTPFIPIASIMVNNHACISHYMAAI